MLGVASGALWAAGCTWPKPAVEPISRWEFDETSSAEGVFEDRGPAHVLMVHAGTWADLTTGSLVEGVGGTSAYTDGSAYATIPADVAAHDLAALTISFYYQRGSAAAKHILLAGGNGSQVSDFSIEVLANGRLRGWHTGQDGVLRFFESTSGVTGTNLHVGTAYRIDLSLGSQGARIYLDGAELTAAAIPENTNGWNNTRVKYLGRWIDGVQAPAVGMFDRLRIWNRQLTSAEIALLEPAQSITLPPLSSSFSCGGGETSVDLGNATDKESTTNLNTGGAACYDATGIISRLRWLGQQGCSSPNRHDTTNQFLYRWQNNHNGGRVFGASWYGNLTKDEDYDPGGDPGNFSLYPCGDQGGMYVRVQGGTLENFIIEGVRSHGAWDPIRTAQASQGTGSELVEFITIRGSWFTCVRDDVWENDSYVDNSVFEDNLVGDVIGSGPTNAGCFRFHSLAGSTSNFTNRRNTISNNLIWASQMHASNRNRGINGYAVGDFFKYKNAICPRVHLTDKVFMADARCFGGGGGDPLWGIKDGGSEAIASSSGNILIWRDLGNNGTYQSLFGDLPPGFTLLTGSEGESEWNSRVNAWKAAHQNVRRFNITGISRPFGGTFNLVDTG